MTYREAAGGAEGRVSRWAQLGDRVGILAELVEFLWEQKLWWMIPTVLVLVGVGMLLIIVESSAIAPFVYTLF